MKFTDISLVPRFRIHDAACLSRQCAQIDGQNLKCILCFGVDRTGDKMTSPSSRITPAFVLLILELFASHTQFVLYLEMLLARFCSM
jgi:hypothetical protein